MRESPLRWGCEMAEPSLTKTLEKVAQAGEYAGFTVQQMIQFLNAGFTIGDLLYVIGRRLEQIPYPCKQPTSVSGWIM